MTKQLFAEWQKKFPYYEPYKPPKKNRITLYNVELAKERSTKPKLFRTFEPDSAFVSMESIYKRGGSKEQIIRMGFLFIEG